MREAGRQPRERRHLRVGAPRDRARASSTSAGSTSVIDLLHENGIAVDLGTPTASPPAWFFANHPDARVVTRDGTVDGLRLARHGVALVARVPRGDRAHRLGARRALRQPPRRRDVARAQRVRRARRRGLLRAVGARVPRLAPRRSYGTLDELNRAWGTAFWGQHYGEWDHVGAPAAAPSVVNPAQRLDFARFTDHQLRECFIAERDAIRAHATQPITTNFMANQSWTTDLWAWAREVDIVSDDHYLWAADPEGEIGLAIAADLSRSVGGGKPWILMEHSTSAVNWQPRNIAKRPGEMARNSLTHLAPRRRRHPLLPVARLALGRREVPLRDDPPRRHVVARLARGRRARRARSSASTRCGARAWWPTSRSCGTSNRSGRRTSSGARPSTCSHAERIRAFYERLLARRHHRRLRAARPGPLGLQAGHRAGPVPADDGGCREPRPATSSRAARSLVSFFSAIVDENDAVHEGGYGAPAARRARRHRSRSSCRCARGDVRRRVDAATATSALAGRRLAGGPRARRRRGRRHLRRRTRRRACRRSRATRTARASAGTSAPASTPRVSRR